MNTFELTGRNAMQYTHTPALIKAYDLQMTLAFTTYSVLR